jgi:hypothetical protein
VISGYLAGHHDYGWACGNPACHALGMSQESSCMSEGELCASEPAKFHTAKAAARAAFKASHPNFPNDNAGVDGVHKFNNNEFV